MTTYEIPTQPRNQSFRISLNDVEYQVIQRWNASINAWVINVNMTDGSPLVHGIALVTGVDLLSQFEHLGLGGAIVVQSDTSVDAVPDYETLGSTGHLYFVTG